MKERHQIIARHRNRASAYLGNSELDEHESRLWFAYLPAEADFDPSRDQEPLPLLVLCEPTPRIIERPLDTVRQTEEGGVEAVRLQRYFISRVSRFIGREDFRSREGRRLGYYLVLPSGVTPTPEAARDKAFTRYRLLGEVSVEMEEYKFALVEAKGSR